MSVLRHDATRCQQVRDRVTRVPACRGRRGAISEFAISEYTVNVAPAKVIDGREAQTFLISVMIPSPSVCCPTVRAAEPTGSGPHERLNPGTLKSYFCPEAKDIAKWCAWGIVGARRGEPFRFVDPSPDPLEPRRQKHARDRHCHRDACHLGISGFCPKRF